MAKRMVRRRKVCMSAVVLLLVVFCVAVGILFWGSIMIFKGPSIQLIGSAELSVEYQTEYVDPGATAKTFYKDYSENIKVNNPVATDILGDYTVTYSLTRGRHTYERTRLVHVVDTVSPTLELKGESELTVSHRKLYKEAGFTAADNCDGDVTADVVITESDIEDGILLQYCVSDRSGNATVCTRTVHIKDTTFPVITLKGGATVYSLVGTSFTDPGYTASDDADGDITSSVTVTGKVDANTQGTYSLTYSIKDSAGNITEVVRKVIVTTAENIGDGVSIIYLTFDDGPSSAVTPQILDALKRNNVKATFFIINYDEKGLEIIKRAIADGHTIGIHGYSHDYKQIYASTDAFIDNVQKLHDKLLADTGYDAKIMRFPGGSSNTVSKNYCAGVVTASAKKLTELGYSYCDWNVDSTDATGNHVKVSQLVENVEKNLRTGHRNYVLMHDAAAKSTTPQCLDEIISYAKARGFRFEPLDEATPMYHHRINN